MIYLIEPYYKLEINDRAIHIYSNSLRSKGRELKQWYTTDGYLRTKINSQSRTIHQIVAEAVLGPRPAGLQINHKDGNKLNNHPNNLEYVTQQENLRHSIELGMHVSNDPTRSGRYKDGRCKNLSSYKLAWYHLNKQRLKERKANDSSS